MQRENEIYCNLCGKKIEVQKEIPVEDYVAVKKTWGYFSKKDGEVHEWHLCEACYDELVRRFQIPVTKTEIKEML